MLSWGALNRFWDLAALGAVLACAVTLLGIAGTARADDAPPKTTLTICSGGLPSLSLLGSAQDGCHSVDVTATEPADADLIWYSTSAFAHVYRDAGDPACIFTAPIHGSPHRAPVLSQAGGGRDARPEDRQVAYIASGWNVWGVTGRSCREAGIIECGGPLCR